MPLNRDIYRRIYIMFDQDEKGCSLYKDRELSGYLKVETRGNRGRLTTALQNLNPNFTYKVKLLKNGDKAVVADFGAVRVDEKGRGGAEWTFDADNIQNTGVKFEEFSVAFIEADDGSNKLIPLSSVMDKKRFNWKSLYKKYLSLLDSDNEKITNKSSDNDDSEIEDKSYTEESKMFEIDSTGSIEDKTDEIYEVELTKENIFTEKKDVNSSYAEAEPDVHDEEKNEVISNFKNTDKKSSDFKIAASENEGYIKYLKEYINNIVNYLEEVQPFEKNLEGYRWWKIKTGHMDGNFDHYLVGFVNDEDGTLKYIAYGMPGFFTLADQPFGGMTGFVFWHPVKENLRGAGDEGYWILHIDAKTGQIAVPKEPTPPPFI